ncbi:hypothetical protein [Vibrio sp. FJH11]
MKSLKDSLPAKWVEMNCYAQVLSMLLGVCDISDVPGYCIAVSWRSGKVTAVSD